MQGADGAMTEPHPQPKCHGYACRVFEECTDRYDDDEFPPCASHSSAVSERDKVLDDVVKKLILKKLISVGWIKWTDLNEVIAELRPQKGEQK
jgi:hypothetical protein